MMASDDSGRGTRTIRVKTQDTTVETVPAWDASSIMNNSSLVHAMIPVMDMTEEIHSLESQSNYSLNTSTYSVNNNSNANYLNQSLGSHRQGNSLPIANQTIESVGSDNTNRSPSSEMDSQSQRSNSGRPSVTIQNENSFDNTSAMNIIHADVDTSMISQQSNSSTSTPPPGIGSVRHMSNSRSFSRSFEQHTPEKRPKQIEATMTMPMSPSPSDDDNGEFADEIVISETSAERRFRVVKCYLVSICIIIFCTMVIPFSLFVMFGNTDVNSHNNNVVDDIPPPARPTNTDQDDQEDVMIVTWKPTPAPVSTSTPSDVDSIDIDSTEKPTEKPTPSPISDGGEVVDFSLNMANRSFMFQDLVDISPTLSKNTSWENLLSPPGLALQWLIEKDALEPIPSGSKLFQRFALLTMDNALHDYGSFMAAEDPQDTFRDRLLDTCEWVGVTCDHEGTVTHLDWSQSELTGTLPDEMYILTGLQELDLHGNELHGDPKVLWELESLESIYLYRNKFQATIGSEIGKLVNLTSLYLGHNEFYGPLPTTIAGSNGQPKPLRNLVLHHNKFQGFIPEGWRLRSLFYLDLGHNQLSGSLPSDWDVQMIRLRHLYLDHNMLSGPIPDNFGQIGNGRMKQLYLNNNNLSGNLPTMWSFF